MSRLPGHVAEVIKGWFATGEIELFIGYLPGAAGMRATPAFVRTPEEVDDLIWDATCENNLVAFLPKHGGRRTGIMVKGCDARAVVGLLQEGQLKRENLRIVGVPCPGVVDPRKVAAGLGLFLDDLDEAEMDIDRITAAGQSMPISAAYHDVCLACRQHNPNVSDVLLGEPVDEEPAQEPYATVHEIEELPEAERWARFSAEMARCNLCYACRNACPLCYCNVCFADRTAPQWANQSVAPEDVHFFQVMRIFHLAGRCVGCGACTRACPQGVNLRLFLDKLRLDAEDLFGYVAGVNPDEQPPLRVYRPEDYNGFVL